MCTKFLTYVHDYNTNTNTIQMPVWQTRSKIIFLNLNQKFKNNERVKLVNLNMDNNGLTSN